MEGLGGINGGEGDAEFPWRLRATSVVSSLRTDLYKGLSSTEARDRKRAHGPNELPKEQETPFWTLVYKQFEDTLVIILLIAAFVSFVLAIFEDAGEDNENDSRVTAFVEPVVILLILIANACVGVWQESDAERAIASLKAYEAFNAVALRDGVESTIAAVDLVPGDVITLRVGNKVPADARIVAIHSAVLTVDQSILTGESDSAPKQTAPIISDGASPRALAQDQTNMVFSGTLITRGSAVAVVTSTGITTAIGKIHSDMTSAEEEPSPLKQKLDKFGEQLAKLIGIICILVWVVNIGNFGDEERGGYLRGAIYYFKIAVALAVAAVPEGLPAVVTTCLALGTRAMAKQGDIVRSLPSVETLGCTTVVCVDKTGTLTTNRMCVQRVLVLEGSDAAVKTFTVSGSDYEPHGDVAIEGSGFHCPAPAAKHSSLASIARVCALCNESAIEFSAEQGRYVRRGEPTEAALRVLVEKLGMPSDTNSTRRPNKMRALQSKGASEDAITRAAGACSAQWTSEYRQDAVLEFTRKRKSMSVVSTHAASGARHLFVKGAPESLLRRCSFVKLNGTHERVPLTDTQRRAILDSVAKLGRDAFRCLAIAEGDPPPQNSSALDIRNPTHYEEIEEKLTLLGVVGMVDPPREEVRDAILGCQSAGIRVVVLTGDNKQTAEAVCRRVGLLDDDELSKGESISGGDWAVLSARERSEIAPRLRLISRCEPSHKLQLVEVLKSCGDVCAMTGDGVNDAPALKRADIGIAIGSGTAVAKEASDMVLANDDFGTIVHAVKQGRQIMANTKAFLRYMISSNLGEVLCIFFAAALGIPEGLSPIQLLFVNLVTDGLPATALGFNKPDPGIMRQRPRKRNADIVDSWVAFRYAVIGLYVGVAVVAGFVWWYMYFADGPLVTWKQLQDFELCTDDVARAYGYTCDVFKAGKGLRSPSTIALSILVTIEMLNALNALSENESLATIPPWSNPLLLGAIAISFGIHCMILYVPFLARIFGTAPLSAAEWTGVFLFSAPVIAIDEAIKCFARRRRQLGSAFGFSFTSKRYWGHLLKGTIPSSPSAIKEV